ncbi:type I-D CRISPR-associated helicase Cas3' [Methanothermococcus sp.]|uniref:type I-D CRISPR-associated helicase Cas3' n=1 Tax=Methanothermococcus sp. TaxID=2614238 RepID=UPI0025E8D21E|nr:type I-D CRISPR-associated helicase Cas3' [Methanothermococcus sp.]
MVCVNITVSKKCLPFGNKTIDKYNINLHKFQEIFYSDIAELNNVNFIAAPTGAGKTFSFSFPIIYAEDNGFFTKPRGLIVVPTNALVSDIEKTLKNLGIKTAILTGNSLTKKGRKRGEELIEITKNNEIIITNPDIINYLLHSGYHRFGHVKNFPDWIEFFNKFDYIIFDEYHIYDEEQLGTILILFLSLWNYFKKIKWFFVSATPEENLIELFKEHSITPNIVIQPLDNNSGGRTIQGEIDIEFIKISKNIERSLFGYLITNEKLNYNVKMEIMSSLSKNEKVLIIFDSLRDAMNFKYILKRELKEDINIWVDTGLQTKEKKENNNRNQMENADIIITTSKSEVGVNYPVSLCYMDSGMYFRNFMQRIGRVGRGKEKCKIYCTITPKIYNNLVENIDNDNIKINYYDFVDLMKNAFEDREFKKDKVPKFCGAILWSVINSMEEYLYKPSYNRRKILENLKDKFQYYWVFYHLNKKMKAIEDDIDEDIVDEDVRDNLLKWWKTIKNSFKRFRNDSIIWKVIYDGGKETEYDLIWLLNNAFVKIDKETKTIFIEDFRDKRENVVVGIDTYSLLEDVISAATIGGKNKAEWFKFIYSDYIGDIFMEKFEIWKIHARKYFNDREFFENLTKDIEMLSPIYSKKRIEIYDLKVNLIEVFNDGDIL